MVLMWIFFAIILFSVFMKKCTLVPPPIFVVLFILFAFSSGIADEENYIYKFNNSSLLTDKFEPLFTFTFSKIHEIGFTYNQFKIILSLVYLVVLTVTIAKCTKNWVWVLGLYAIYPFAMDVVQIRNTCALIFIYVALFRMISVVEIKKRDILIYVIFIAIASLFHIMSIALLLLIPLLLLDLNKIKQISVIVSISILILPKFIIKIVTMVVNRFGMSYRFLKYVNDYKLSFSAMNLRKCITVSIMLVLYIAVYKMISKGLKNKCLNREEMESICFLERVYKIDIGLLTVIPLTLIVPDVYRIATELALLNYVAWAKSINQKSTFIRRKKDLLLSVFAVLICIINLYWLVLGSVIINTVWYPLFYNNTLI